jgi:hypothetical protein
LKSESGERNWNEAGVKNAGLFCIREVTRIRSGLITGIPAIRVIPQGKTSVKQRFERTPATPRHVKRLYFTFFTDPLLPIFSSGS